MESPYSDDGIVHGVQGRSAASLGFNAHPSSSAAIFIDAVESVLTDHDDRVTSLRLRKNRVQIWK